MGTLNAFIHVTVDGFFAGPKGEIDWFKSVPKDDALHTYLHEQSKSGNTLLFGRTTYEMMKSYWPTPEASKSDPEMAQVMINSKKVVFSRTLKSVEEGPNWKNVSLVRDVKGHEIRKLKEQGDLTILGSGTIVQQLTNLGLIDDYMLVHVPVILGAGKPLFAGVKKTDLHLLEAKSFPNGMMVTNFRPS